MSGEREEVSSTNLFIEAFIKWVESYGVMLKSIGEIEKLSGKTIDELVKIFLNQENISKMLEKLPSELVGRLFSLVFEIQMLVVSTRDLKSLSPSKKIEIGDRLVRLSEELRETVKEIEKIMGKGEGSSQA